MGQFRPNVGSETLSLCGSLVCGLTVELRATAPGASQTRVCKFWISNGAQETRLTRGSLKNDTYVTMILIKQEMQTTI